MEARPGGGRRAGLILDKYAGAYAAFGDILEVTVDGTQLLGTISRDPETNMLFYQDLLYKPAASAAGQDR